MEELKRLEDRFKGLCDGKAGGVLWEGQVFDLSNKIFELHNSIPSNTVLMRPKDKYQCTQPLKKVKGKAA